MGNQNSNQSFGTITIQTSKKRFNPQEQVNGTIYLNLIQPFPSNTLYLYLKGIEVVSLKEKKTNT